MNDDRSLRCIKVQEQVGCRWWPKEVGNEAINGLSPVSKWLLRTVFDNLRNAENGLHALVAIGNSIEVIEKNEYNMLRDDLIRLGYSADEVSRDFSELYSSDITLPSDYKID